MLKGVLDSSELFQLGVGHFEVTHEILVNVILARGDVVSPGQLILSQPVLEVVDFTSELCVFNVASIFTH